jgi:Tfp pilus assembly protein PilF
VGKALHLDPNCAEAYAIRAGIHRDRMDFADAVADYARAIELDPARKTALQMQLDKAQAMLQ